MDHAGMPELTVVIPTFRNPAGVAAILERLEQGRRPDEVLVVDNGGDAQTQVSLAATVARSGLPVRLLRIDVNAGPAAARNLGWREASTEVVAYLDDDVVPAPTWTEAIGGAFRDPATGVVQGRTTPPSGTDETTLEGWYVIRDVAGPTPWFEACNLAFRRKALASTGGFDESMGFYGEDTAAGWAVVGAGWGRGFEPDAVVVHPIDPRGWSWFLRHAWLEQNLVAVAARYPSFREEAQWRSWALRPDGPLLLAAVVGIGLTGAGLVAGRRGGAPLALALPYAWSRREHARFLHRLPLGAQHVVHDGVRLAAHLRGSIRHRVLIL